MASGRGALFSEATRAKKLKYYILMTFSSLDIPIYSTASSLSFSEAFALPSFSLSCDWFGAAITSLIQINLVIDARRLYFGASCTQTAHFSPFETGTFHEGLWLADVIELFLKDDFSNAYQEFNLSPCGAWWTATFSQYRQRLPSPYLDFPLEIKSSINAQSWFVGAAFERSQIKVPISFGPQSLGSVHAIIGEHPRIYAGLKPARGEPDFHQEDSFLPFRMLNYGAA